MSGLGEPCAVTVVEVGPRDGLQNEAAVVPTDIKVAFINALSDAGFPVIECTSFVSPKAVPQLADAEDVMRQLRRRPGTRYLVLVPNERGLDRALAVGCDAIALFTAASEAFSEANVHASIAETFTRFQSVATRAQQLGLWMRGYVSTAFWCPYAGRVLPEQVMPVVLRLFELGCAEVALADTIGRASPDEVAQLLDVVLREVPAERLALHFHDTNGLARANIRVGLAYGIRVFDGSVGGLGGCPFAPGAPGNVATEAVLDELDAAGCTHGIDRAALVRARTLLATALPTVSHRTASV